MDVLTLITPGSIPLRLIVHPIDKAKHPTWAGHFRWCVQLGDNPCDTEAMAQALVADSAWSAARDGEFVALAFIKLLRMIGAPPVDYPGPTFLDSDPLPPD